LKSSKDIRSTDRKGSLRNGTAFLLRGIFDEALRHIPGPVMDQSPTIQTDAIIVKCEITLRRSADNTPDCLRRYRQDTVMHKRNEQEPGMEDKRHTIFIVDDDASVRRSLSRLIRSVNMNALAYDSAEEFLKAVPIDSEGCLILDVSMPGMNGFMLQERLLTADSPLRIIFITAFQKPGDSELAMKRGAKGYLQKPFSDEELLTLIAVCVEKSP